MWDNARRLLFARISWPSRYGLRELLLVTAIVAIALAWWVDRRRYETRLTLAKLQVQQAQKNQGYVPPPLPGRPERPSYRRHDTSCPFATTEEFIAFLRQTDGAWMELTHNALGARNPPLGASAAPSVVALLSDPDADVRARAAVALGYMEARPDIAVPALILLLDEPSIEVQYQAASALTSLKSDAKPAIPALRKIMLNDDSELAALAGLCISQIDPQQQLGARFKQLLTNKNRKNRLLAIRELRYHLDPDDAERALVSAFSREKDAVVRDLIAQTLNRIP